MYIIILCVPCINRSECVGRWNSNANVHCLAGCLHTVSSTDIDITVDFDTITRSLTEPITIVEGITLLSTLVTIQCLYQIRSVIAVRSSFDGVGRITFICSGNTPSSTFENIATISLVLDQIFNQPHVSS